MSAADSMNILAKLTHDQRMEAEEITDELHGDYDALRKFVYLDVAERLSRPYTPEQVEAMSLELSQVRQDMEAMASRIFNLEKAAAVIRDAFHYDPGHSDLDNEQPIQIGVTLG